MSWGLVAVGVAAVGAGVNAYGQAKAGRAADKASQANAYVFSQNAKFAEQERPMIVEQSRIEQRRLAEKYHAIVGEFRASTAAGGIDPNFGSAAQTQEDARQAYNIDKRILAQNEVAALRDKDIEAWNYRNQASISRMEGKAARTAGNLNALATLLGAAGTISKSLPQGG